MSCEFNNGSACAYTALKSTLSIAGTSHRNSHMLAYYSIDEVAQKSGLSSEQVLRLGCSGTLVFSILDHSPQNFEEVEEEKHEDGSLTVRTRTNETTVIVRPKGPSLRLKYIGAEDVINIITNHAPNRRTLVRAVYSTRELDPKKGSWSLNNPRKLAPSDLVVSQEEWELFAKGPGKNIKKYLPLVLPEKITVLWLIKNLSVANWISVAGFTVSIFGAGVYFSQTEAYEKVKTIFIVPAKDKAAISGSLFNERSLAVAEPSR